MENDKNIIEKVSKLFLEYGAKAVTMDDIAKALRVSKKTLYEKYKSKEVLIEETLVYGIEKVLQKMKDLDNKIDNAVERMFARDEDIEKMSQTNNSIHLKQLMKYYPEIFNRHMFYFSERLSEILVHNIERGRKQGLYREDFDEQFYAKLFFHLAMSIDGSPYFKTEDLSRREYQQKTLRFYMNSITTEKGKEVMKNLPL
tara:strand:- start:377 stop:976 length:600 start_codon:yes stop_codon:yes gene_type:complete